MGNSDSHAAFADGVRRLVDEDVDETDTAFWSSIFTAPLSVEDIFEVISPTAVRNLCKRPRNLQLVLRKMASTMASVCASADEGQLPSQNATMQGAFYTTIRLLTRMAPFLHEALENSAVHEILWRPGGLSEGDASPPPPIHRSDGSEAKSPPSCGSELLHYLGRFLFLPGFTISPRTKMTGKHRGDIPKHRVDERVVWSGGVGISDKLSVMPAQPFMKARTEALGCLLACLSGPLFQTAEEYKESPPEWLSHFVSGEVAHTANLFCSLMSTISSYDPGRGLPYGQYFKTGPQEDLVDKALQILCVALDFQPKEDEHQDGAGFEAAWFLVDNSQLQAKSFGLGYRGSKDLDDLVPSKAAVWGEKVPGHDLGDGWIQVGNFYLPEELEGKRVLIPQNPEEMLTPSTRKPSNVYRYMLEHVSKEAEIDLVFTGLLKLLSSVYQAEQTYLLHSMRPVGFYQEALVLLWHVLTLNPTFTKRVVERHDTNQFLLSLIYLLQQARTSVQLIGLLHTTSFVLLVLSSERAFAVRLNEPYVSKKVPVEIPSFNGNHADVLALSLYKVISESLAKPQNDALVEMLLTALCNVSPYVKSFCLESCLKLISLAERLARPSYIFRTAFTHHGLVFLVELLNNIVQYQYEGNTMMVYAILRQAEVFNKLDRLSLADAKKPAQEEGSTEVKRWEPTEEWLQGVKKKLPLQTLQCLIEYLNPQLEVLCVEKEVTDQQEVMRFLKATTLVGILPVPHPIVIRTYQASSYTSMWFTSYMWGVIFTRSQRMPLYDWKKIRLVTINN